MLAVFKQLILKENLLSHFNSYLWSWGIKTMGEGVVTKER